MQLKEILRFFFELGQLFRVKREGWRLLGIDQPESVADHSLRAAQIGWVLATMEGYSDPNQVAATLIFHDMNECRIGDLHRVASRYVSADSTTVVREQTKDLGEIGERIFQLWHQNKELNSTAGVIAKDADLVELAVRAKEYMDLGVKGASEWFENAEAKVKTESAKRLLELLRSSTNTKWW